MDRFASCAKSAISIDEQTCHKQSCMQLKKRWQQVFESSNLEDSLMLNKEQMISEINRVKRKLAITQKSKNVLADELSLVKEELQVALRKIRSMRQMKQTNEQLSVSRISMFQSDISQKIVIKEKEEQIDMLITSLKQKNREIDSLKSLNIQLNDEICSKNNILAKVQDSNSSQLSFYRREIADLEEALQSKKKELQQKQKCLAKCIEKERQQWNKMSKILKNKLISCQQQLEKAQQVKIKLIKTIKQLELKIKQKDQQLQNKKQESSWLKGLIEQAKIEYIHTQLVKLQNKDKVTKDLQEKKKRYKVVQLNKHLKSQADVTTVPPSAKTQRNSSNSSTVYIAPFKLAPQEISLNQLQLSSSLQRSPFNQY